MAGRRRNRAGLLITLFLIPLFLAAQEEDQPLVLVQKSPDEPAAGSTWTLTLLIPHEEPRDVTIFAPPFTGSLYLEQVLKGPRVIDLENWTFQEYRFLLNSPDIIEFDSFTIVTPDWQEETEPFELEIQEPKNTAGTQQIRLNWEGIPSALQIGQSTVLSLKLNNIRQAPQLPEADFFRPPLAEGFIMESSRPTAEEKASGIALKLRITPLEAKPFVLTRRQLIQYNSIFEIPALNIRVNQPVKIETESGESDLGKSNDLIFPSLDAAAINNRPLFLKYKNDCEKIYSSAKQLWEEGKKVQALVLLRLNERDHQGGAVFESLRVMAEQALGLKNTAGEKNNAGFSGEKTAVLLETSIRRIPDLMGSEITVLAEGQPVLIHSAAIKNKILWRRVITNDQRKISGWVPEEKIIFY